MSQPEYTSPVEGRHDLDTPLLDALFAPGSGADFRRRYWPERHFAIHGPLSRLPAFFKTRELSSLDSLSDIYSGGVSFGRGSKEARTLDIRAHPSSLYRLGLSVCLHDIGSVIPGARDFLRAFERELGLIAGCGRIAAFASPESDGVSLHFDAEEVFSIQLQGTKTFELARTEEISFPWGEQYGPGMEPFDLLYPQTSSGFPKAPETNFETVEMKPGSILFMPRGLWHRTIASENSLSVSIILRPPSPLDAALQQIQLLLLQDENWRRPLYGAWDDGNGTEDALLRARKLVEDLPRIVGKLTPEHLISRTEPHRLAHIDADTRFQRIPSSRLSIETESGKRQLTVRALDREWIERDTWRTILAPDYEPLFQWIIGREAAFSFDSFFREFPRFPAPILREILAALTRARFLRLLPFPRLEDFD